MSKIGDPVGVLSRKIRKDRGSQTSLSPKLRMYLLAQYRQHASWSCQLHVDNLLQAVRNQPELGAHHDAVRRSIRPAQHRTRRS